MLDSKGRGLHIGACHLSHWEEGVLCDFQENSIWLRHPSSSEAEFVGQGREISSLGQPTLWEKQISFHAQEPFQEFGRGSVFTLRAIAWVWPRFPGGD